MAYKEAHRPQIGDKFWNKSRHLDEGKQPNGYISWVDYEGREVVVTYLEDGGTEDFTWDEIEDCWEPAKFGGIYLLYPLTSLRKRRAVVM